MQSISGHQPTKRRLFHIVVYFCILPHTHTHKNRFGFEYQRCAYHISNNMRDRCFNPNFSAPIIASGASSASSALSSSASTATANKDSASSSAVSSSSLSSSSRGDGAAHNHHRRPSSSSSRLLWTPLRVLLFVLWCAGGCVYRLVTAPLPRLRSLFFCCGGGGGDDANTDAATRSASSTSSSSSFSSSASSKFSSSSKSSSSPSSSFSASPALTLVDYFNLAQQLERRLSEIAQWPALWRRLHSPKRIK